MRRLLAFILAAILLACGGFRVVPTGKAMNFEKSVYSSHANESKKIAITFDDGPHPRYTNIILDILAQYNAKATFFLIGTNVKQYPELLGRILKEGHEIGNHTYLHANLQKTPSDKIITQILEAEETILEITDHRTKVFRPPGGLYNKKVCDAAHALDYEVILWTIDTMDWAHTPVDEIVEKVESNIKSGDIILCHDYISGKPSPTPDALRQILPDLIEEGYEFVTVSELIHSK